jgi:hypothetical protein
MPRQFLWKKYCVFSVMIILTSDLPLNRTEIPSFWWRYFSDRNPEKDSKNPDYVYSVQNREVIPTE